MQVSCSKVSLWAMCFIGLAASAAAQRGTPGSLLLYPQVDTRLERGMVNLITVTNTEPETPAGTLATQWAYVDGSDCVTYEFTEPLEENDTLTVVANAHNDHELQGYLYIYAVRKVDKVPIVHNYLIGTSTILNGFEALEYTVEPLSFEGIGDGVITDLDDDGVRDFDGNEYAMVADELIVPRFFGQSGYSTSELVMIDLTGGAGFTCIVYGVLFNDNEEIFTFEHSFQCWTRVPLMTVSPAFSNVWLTSSNHDPDEVVGATTIESGWVRLDGNAAVSDTVTIPYPAIAGLLIEGRADTSTRAVVQLVGTGEQDNGGVLPNGGITPRKGR